MTMQENNKKIAKNTVALYIRMAITMVVSFFTVRITLQVLGSDDYGLNNLVGSIVALFSFINGSMGTAVQRFYSYEIGKNNQQRLAKVFGVGLYLHCWVAAITLLVGEVFAFFFLGKLNIPAERMFAAHVVFQISLLSLLLNIINVPYAALLRAREDFAKFATLDIIQALCRLVILYLLYVISFDKLITLSVMNFSITLMYILAVNYLARKYKETAFRIDRDKTLVKEMTGFISMLLFTVLFSLLRDKGIVVLINIFFNLTINAAYAIAAQIMTMVNTFAMNFKQAMVPQIMAAYSAGNRGRMNQLIDSGTKITFVLLLLITAPVIVEPHFVLDIILADVPPYAPQFTVLVLINVNVASFTYFLYQSVHATGKIKWQQTYMSGLYLLNVVLIFVVFKLGGNCLSAIYVTIGCSLLQCMVNIWFAKRTFDFDIANFMKKIVARSILMALLVFSVIMLVPAQEESWGRFLVHTSVMYGMIILSCVFFYLDKQERENLKALISKKWGKK